jgi:hypothetical protein
MFETFFNGVRAICPNVTREAISSNTWRITVGDESLIIYEAYWADLLDGDHVRGTFEVEDLYELAWYPWINYRLREQFQHKYSKRRVQWWTCVLATLVPFVYLGHDWGWRFLLSPVYERWERFLDEIPGDVVNFVKSAGGAYTQAEPGNAYRGGDWVDIKVDKLAPKADEIIDRLLELLDRASQRDKCTEIHILAHSLGTVVVHQALVLHTTDASRSGEAKARITRLYTIGCPLEKIQFFWPKLFEQRVNWAIVRKCQIIAQLDPSLQWDNFWSRSDLVSGELSSFPGLPEPRNHFAQGLGGFFTAHVRYLGNYEFLRTVLEAAIPDFKVGGIPTSSVYAKVISTLQNLVAPIAFFGFACLGLAGVGAVGWIVAWVWAALLDWLGGKLEWDILIGHFWWLKWFFWIGIANIVFVTFTAEARRKAKLGHEKYWGPTDYRRKASD